MDGDRYTIPVLTKWRLKMKLSLELLKSLSACNEGINLVKDGKLVGFPLDRLDEVWGDYGSFKFWLKQSLNEFEITQEKKENGNVVISLEDPGYEIRSFEFDSNVNEIYYKKTYIKSGHRDYEIWRKYNDQGKLIYCLDSDGDEEWFDYDENGRKVHEKYSNGYEKWFGYDEKGNLVYTKQKDYQTWRDYNENGRMIHFKDSDGNEEWHTYDENNKHLSTRDNHGYEEWFDLDDVYVREIKIYREHYPDGQLKRINNMEIPWFEK
jgi:YD repeat-containing protein